MAKQARGLYRTRGVGGLPNDARVSDGTIAMDIPEQRYRDNGYEPPFDDLPWKEDYEAAQARKGGNDAQGA